MICMMKDNRQIVKNFETEAELCIALDVPNASSPDLSTEAP